MIKYRAKGSFSLVNQNQYFGGWLMLVDRP